MMPRHEPTVRDLWRLANDYGWALKLGPNLTFSASRPIPGGMEIVASTAPLSWESWRAALTRPVAEPKGETRP